MTWQKNGLPIQAETVDQILKIINSLPFYVLLVDDVHEIVLANEAVKSTLKMEAKDIVGKYCPKVVHGSSEPINECPLEEAVMSNKAVKREYFDTNYQRWLSSEIYPVSLKTNEDKNLYFHIVQDITDRKKAELDLIKSIDKLHSITNAVIKAMTMTVEKRDPYTAGHQERVSKIAYEIAREMKLSEEQCEGVRVAALLHDIGKIGVPIEILCKPGKITPNEFNIIKNHSEIGYEILKEIEFPWPLAKIVLQHHERLNGSGYPYGLKEKDIKLEAKILAVADVVEAMISHRPYRKAVGLDKALEEIERKQTTYFDKNVVNVCIKLFSDASLSVGEL